MEHFAESQMRQLRLVGKGIRKWRKNGVAQMLNLSATERGTFDQGDIPQGIDNDIQDAVQLVWGSFFKMISKVISSLFSLGLLIWLNARGKQGNVGWLAA